MSRQNLAAVEDDDKPAQPANVERLLANIQSANIAADMDSTELARIGAKVCEEYDIDIASRDASGWTERNKRAMALALQTKEVKTYPWPNASNVKWPLIVTAAIQFNARAYPAIVDGPNVAKCKVLGEPTEEKQARADRVGKFMSWQLIEQMDGWEEDTDRLLINLPIVGCAFRKSYFDTGAKKNCSHMITADKFVVNYWTKDLESCPRATEICTFYPNEIEERFRDGRWRRVKLGQVQSAANDDQAPHEFLEQHRLLDLDDDGYAEPYIVTVHKESEQVVRIFARYDDEGVSGNDKGEVTRIVPTRYYTKYGFIPSPDGAFYDVGFGHLLDAINETVNSTFNQLMDSGHLANTQGGFLGAGVSMKASALRFQPGEFKRLETSGQTLKDNIVLLPTKEPSAVLFSLLGMLIEAAKDITATKDILTGETQGNDQAVGTTLAMIEQGLKVFTAIYKRIHRALKQELALLYRLNRVYGQPKEYFEFGDDRMYVEQKDFAEQGLDVVPVSDPTVVSDMQKLTRAQFLGQFKGDPTMNQREINRRMLEAASIPDTKALFAPEPQGPPPEVMAMQAEAENARDKLHLDAQQLDLDARKLALDEANAKTANTLKYAQVISTLSGVGKSTTKSADGTTQTTDTGLSEGTIPLAVHLMAVAEEEIERSQANLQEAHDPDAGTADIGNLQPVEGQPADPGVPVIPAGQSGSAGAPMGDDTGADLGPDANQGPADGGIG